MLNYRETPKRSSGKHPFSGEINISILEKFELVNVERGIFLCNVESSKDSLPFRRRHPTEICTLNFNAPVKLQVHLQRWHPLAFAQIHSPSPRIRKEKKNSLKRTPIFHSFSYGPNDEQLYIPFSPPHTSPLRHFDSITVLNRTIEPYSPGISTFLPEEHALTKLLLLNSKHLRNFKYIPTHSSTPIINVYNRFSRPTIFPCLRKLTHPYQTNIDIEKFGYKVPAIQKINWIISDENNFPSKDIEKLATEYFTKYPLLDEINCIVIISTEEARTRITRCIARFSPHKS